VRAADLIEEAADATLMRSECATFLNWTAALPDEALRARPILVVYQAWMLILDGQPLEVVEARVQEVSEADTAGSISGEVAVFQALIAAYQGDTRRSAELANHALELLPEERLFLRSVVAGLLGLNYLYRGDLVTARRALKQSVRVSQQAGNLMMAVISTCHLAELSMIQARLHQAREIYEQALDLAVDDQGRLLPVAGVALIGLGNLLREWNDLEAARRHLLEGIDLAERWGEVGAINGYVGLARIKQALGDPRGARQAIQTAQRLAISFDAMEMDDILVGANQVRLWLEQGELGPAVRWIEERGLGGNTSLAQLEEEVGSASLTFYKTLEYLVLVQVTIAQGQPAQALEVLELLHPAAEAGGWTWYVVGILILKSLAFQAQGNSTQAMTCLEGAITLAEPGGYVRIFIDEGPPMAALLRTAVARNIAPQYASKLLAAFDAHGEVAPTLPQIQAMIEPLSERELEVLRLIAAGLSNREIAQELVIAISTAKTHINNIYRKLDVSSRTQAVARARELNLLA
jgi:LuxR family maltose regulon positive regulatory protein